LVFAAVLLPQSIFIILMSLSAIASGSDPLPPQEGNLPIGSTLLAIIISLVNSAVFIALILDLHIRQRDDMRRDLVTARVEQSRLAEREQILADMHDGLGSQLATAKLKAESGHLNQEQVVNLLRECMADLHLLVDSLRDQGDGLAAALADHRYRTERRLAGIDIQLAWQVELDDAPVLPPKTTIQVLRIVQEAINNALKHAHAHKIVIAANYSREHGFVIRVEDDGYGIPAEPTQQQGLRNMHRRARDIGATLTVRRGAEDKGTVVELANLESR
jgi:signal transduction histidine kinase